MRVVRRPKSGTPSNDPGNWWKSYKSDAAKRDVLWDAWDEQPRLKLAQADRFAADVEGAHWRNQVLHIAVWI